MQLALIVQLSIAMLAGELAGSLPITASWCVARSAARLRDRCVARALGRARYGSTTRIDRGSVLRILQSRALDRERLHSHRGQRGSCNGVVASGWNRRNRWVSRELRHCDLTGLVMERLAA